MLNNIANAGPRCEISTQEWCLVVVPAVVPGCCACCGAWLLCLLRCLVVVPAAAAAVLVVYRRLDFFFLSSFLSPHPPLPLLNKHDLIQMVAKWGPVG